MEKPSEIVQWFFLFLQTESAMLMRIEFLVVVIAVLYQLMSFLDQWRRRSRSSTMKYVLLILDAIADSTFLYTIGLMQNAPFKKDLFPVWALVLSNLRFSGCFISAYGIPDQENRRISEMSNVMALLGVAFLNSTRNSQFRHPIWALCVMQLVRSFYLIYAYNIAVGSPLHGKSSMYVVMSSQVPDHHRRPDESSEVNLNRMEGYKYPVCGDQNQKLKVKAPRYDFDLNIIDDDETTEPTRHTRRQRLFFGYFCRGKQWYKRAPTTLDRIWKPDGAVSNMACEKDVKLIKDMCLSFSLYRLLRCKFDDLSVDSDIAEKTKRLLWKIMEDDDRKRTFRIIESELAFLNDYFYTRYPVLFFRGFPVMGSLHPVLTIAFTFWLGRDIHKVYRPRVGEVAHVVHGVNVDLIITWVFMGVVVVKELWKMLIYLLSDWTKVMVLCEYVAENMMWVPKLIRDKLVGLVCSPRFKIVPRWHRKIDQYDFLRAYVYSPWKRDIFFYMSLGIFPRGKKGVKLGKSVDLPVEVNHAILNSLRSLRFSKDSLEVNNDHVLPSVAKFLSRINQSATDRIGRQLLLKEMINKTLRKQPTRSHTILVWHIATSLCEIDLAQHYNTRLTESEVLHSLKLARSCFSTQQPYMIKVQRLERALRANYTVANSISRYCTYLLASVPELLPDSNFVPELILKSTVREASKILDGCDNLQSIYRRLMREAEELQDTNDGDDDDQTEDDGCKWSELPGVSCLLTCIKGIYRCFFPEKNGRGDGGQPSTNGNGEIGSRSGENGDAHTAISVDQEERNDESGGGGGGEGADAARHEKIITMGARLGRLLIDATKHDDVARWELLAGVWADLLVHMAPSWNTEAHRKCLATGGEFITHIWAILCHCGVDKSDLWELKEGAGEDEGQAEQTAAATTAADQTLATGEAATVSGVAQQGEASTSSARP
uniref:DUF4220 domain-containing protein n=1 Tax=Oryza meridionalis TaxID=40149 RepID=A0A0E0EYG4_9ORYZ